MGALAEVSVRRNKPSSLAPSHRLIIGGEDLSEHLITARVVYEAEGGGSGCELELVGNFEDYNDAPITLELGWGPHITPYFRGWVTYANIGESFYSTSLQAFGTYRRMSDQILGTQETYLHKTIEYVIADLARRCGYGPGQIEVRGGRSYVVQPGELFPFDTTCADVLSTLFEKADFVGVDQPGGRRLFMPRPNGLGGQGISFVYQPGDYEAGGFTVSQGETPSYSKVVVYRRDDRGVEVVRAEQEVDPPTRFGPPRNRVYVVPDFTGDQGEAEKEAYRIAQRLRRGVKEFTLSAPANLELELYSAIKVETSRRLADGSEEARSYRCFVDKSISVSYGFGEMKMELSGTAVELTQERRREEPPLPESASPGVVYLPRLFPSEELYPSEKLYPEG